MGLVSQNEKKREGRLRKIEFERSEDSDAKNGSLEFLSFLEINSLSLWTSCSVLFLFFP